ncbi:MAG: cyanophycinase [Bacteroidetes bacterium]|jgi:cyanophycinase|nr:cyanophycinase [Bacteroidota bacterium]
MGSVTGKQGVLIPIGGGEDRGEELEPVLPFETKGVLKHILTEANGVDSKVVLITTASKIPMEVAQQYRHGFNRLKCRSFKHYHFIDKTTCDEPEVMKDFEEADVVMFSGGNQSRLPRFLGKSALIAMLAERYKNDSLVIAGTSAGAMAMSKYMIAGGSASEAFYKGAVKTGQGFGLIANLIIDTHFVRRGRFGRLAEAVAKYPQCVGIGLAEDTGVVIKDGQDIRVIGSGMTIVMDPRTVTHNNHKILKEGTLLSMTGLTVHLLSNGDRFSLAEHATKVLPMGESYI